MPETAVLTNAQLQDAYDINTVVSILRTGKPPKILPRAEAKYIKMGTRACVECEKRFDLVRGREHKQYCTERCRKRVSDRRRSSKDKARRKRSYERHKPTILAKAKAQRISKQRFVLGYKLTIPCPCGESDPCCLDFNHRDHSTKEYGISRMVKKGSNLARLVAEIEKCDVLCANCHRKFHYRERVAKGQLPEIETV